MTAHVFTYGTLMCADIMRAACGGLPAASSARLYGFSRHPVAGEEYPGIRRAPEACVEGVVYHDASPEQLARLDAFEGSQYVRQDVEIVLDDGRRLNAQTYVFADEQLHLLRPGDWNYTAFLERGRARFEGRYLGFGRV